jgi:hypothetical protein
MLKILVAALLAVSLNSHAEVVTIEKPIVCDTLENVTKRLNESYGEVPIAVLDSDKTKIAVLVNFKSTSWTVIEFNKELSCILGVGTGFNLKSFNYKNIQL